MTAIEHDLKRFISQNIRMSGVFPTLQEVCTAFNFSHDQARKYMTSLAEDGYVEAQGQWFKFPEHKATEVIGEDLLEVNTPQLLEVGPEKPKRGRPFGSVKKDVPQESVNILTPELKAEQKVYNIQIKIIQAVMAFIGTGAAIISIYYTSVWMLEFLPGVLALLLSLIIVGFSVFAFEVMIIFLTDQITSKKLVKVGVVAGFGILWFIATSFSLASTVAGQVNKDLQKKDIKAESSDYDGKLKWSLLQEKKVEIKERTADYKQQIQTYQKILSGMNSVSERKQNKGAWNDINYKLQKTQENISKLSVEMEDVRTQEKAILSTVKNKTILSQAGTEDQESFYTWLSKVLNIRADRIQFLLALFPAIFCDLISPSALAVALFLRNK